MRRAKTYTSQSIVKNRRGWNTSRPHPQKKGRKEGKGKEKRKKERKERKLQAPIFDENRCKNPQQNISKPTLGTTNKRDDTSGSRWISSSVSRTFQYLDIRRSYCGSAVMNPTSNHEDTGSIPGLAQWVKDLVVP